MPAIIRDADGRIRKHWTMEEAEAAEAERRAQAQAKLVSRERGGLIVGLANLKSEICNLKYGNGQERA